MCIRDSVKSLRSGTNLIPTLQMRHAKISLPPDETSHKARQIPKQHDEAKAAQKQG